MAELYHYGVLGMKWGVRKDRQRSGSRNLYGVTKKKNNATIKIDSITDKRWKEDIDRQIGEKNPGYYMSKEEAESKLKRLRRANMHLTDEQQLRATNHARPVNQPDRYVNCFECTLAYEMRQRGYVCQSNLKNGGKALQVLHAFDAKDISRIEAKSIDECYEEMKNLCLSYGEGARGMLGFQYKDYDSGHAMSWRIRDGKFEIVDPQVGEDGYDTFMMGDGNVDIYRLDNAAVLPGVMDFIEEFSPSEKELEKAEQRANEGKERLEKAKKERAKEIEAAKKADERREKEAKRRDMNVLQKGIDVSKDAIQIVVKSTKENVSRFIATGSAKVKNFLKNPLNIQFKIQDIDEDK